MRCPFQPVSPHAHTFIVAVLNTFCKTAITEQKGSKMFYSAYAGGKDREGNIRCRKRVGFQGSNNFFAVSWLSGRGFKGDCLLIPIFLALHANLRSTASLLSFNDSSVLGFIILFLKVVEK